MSVERRSRPRVPTAGGWARSPGPGMPALAEAARRAASVRAGCSFRRQPMVTDSLPAAVSEEQLWSAYARCRDARRREQLVERYRRLAYAALKRLHGLGIGAWEKVALLASTKPFVAFDPAAGLN